MSDAKWRICWLWTDIVNEPIKACWHMNLPKRAAIVEVYYNGNLESSSAHQWFDKSKLETALLWYKWNTSKIQLMCENPIWVQTTEWYPKHPLRMVPLLGYPIQLQC
jgi:hypothetical protein